MTPGSMKICGGPRNLLWIALPDERVSRLIMQLDALKKSYLKPHALQVFVFPVEGN